MTTPSERMRALRFGRELSEILEQNLSVGPRVHMLAQQALAAYPTARRWSDLLDRRGAPLPHELAGAMHLMRQLLVDSAVSKDEQDEWCDAVRRTLRHFPSTFEIDAWCAPDAKDDIRRHLAPESPWDRCVIAAYGPLRTFDVSRKD